MKEVLTPKVGDIVKYVIDGPEDPKVCGVWTYSFGLLLSHDKEKEIMTIMSSKQDVHVIKSFWVEKANEDSWLPGQGYSKES